MKYLLFYHLNSDPDALHSEHNSLAKAREELKLQVSAERNLHGNSVFKDKEDTYTCINHEVPYIIQWFIKKESSSTRSIVNNNNQSSKSSKIMAKKLEGTPYKYPSNHPKAGQNVVNTKTGKPYVWARGTKQQTTKSGQPFVSIEVPLSVVRKPNNFFTQGVKTRRVQDKDGIVRDHKYVIGYYRLNRKTQAGHDARVWIVARQYYQGGKPALFDVYYKGMSYYTAQNVFDGIACNTGWQNGYNKRTGQNFMREFQSDGTAKSAINYVNRKREARLYAKEHGVSFSEAYKYLRAQ